MRQDIKNIIFDLGGVLFNLDYKQSLIAINKLLAIDINADSVLKKDILNHIAGYNKGYITTERFIWKFQRLASGKTPQGQDIIRAWNAMMLGWNPEVFEMLATLKKKYNLYLLSNINEIHFKFYEKSLTPYGGLSHFESHFIQTYYSHKIHLVKPEKEAYSFVINQHDLQSSETIFIDDTEENIISAQALGISVVCHPHDVSIIDHIHSYLQINS